jgi:hypothetical protein
MAEIKDDVFYFSFVLVLLSWVTIAMCFFYVGDGCKKCPKCPAARDSITQAPACTVLVDSSRIKIRDSIRIRTVRDTVSDTVPVYVEVRDTGKVADIADTTMSDGAKVGITFRARLIVPPVSAAIRYTPAPDSGSVWTFYDTTTVYKTSWKGITIGALGGVVIGVAGAATLIYLLTQD